MADPYAVQPVGGPVTGSIRPPGSKSLTNRALLIAGLACGQSRLIGALDSDDTRVMIESLRRLAIEVEVDAESGDIDIHGCGGTWPTEGAALELENSGTAIRFLVAAAALGQGRFTLDGNQRMRQRPIADLVDALGQLGARVCCIAEDGCPPVEVIADGLPGGEATVPGSISSQFLSGLLLAAPCASGTTTLRVEGPLVSRPYIDMTLGLMREFSAEVVEDPAGTFTVTRGDYIATNCTIEPDASAASYFLAAAAITGGTVTIEGLGRDSLQGDIAFADALVRMGCRLSFDEAGMVLSGGPLVGIDIEMNAISDTAQTLAVVAAFAEGPTRIRGIAHARLKETDRVAAVVSELRRLGVAAEEHDDGLSVQPGPLEPGVVETYDDHRMAMSFAVAGLKAPGIAIADPGCVAKTYPGYFADLERLCGTAR